MELGQPRGGWRIHGKVGKRGSLTVQLRVAHMKLHMELHMKITYEITYGITYEITYEISYGITYEITYGIMKSWKRMYANP